MTSKPKGARMKAGRGLGKTCKPTLPTVYKVALTDATLGRVGAFACKPGHEPEEGMVVYLVGKAYVVGKCVKQFTLCRETKTTIIQRRNTAEPAKVEIDVSVDGLGLVGSTKLGPHKPSAGMVVSLPVPKENVDPGSPQEQGQFQLLECFDSSYDDKDNTLVERWDAIRV